METHLSLLDQGVLVIKESLKTMPSLPGVYRMLNTAGDALYVGKAKNLKKRVFSYTQVTKLPNRLQRMVSETVRMEIVITETETEALLLESNLIKKLQPRYNVLLKDDKSFPYILLTKNHPFGRIVKHRGPEAVKGDYFGPFASVLAVDETVLTLQKIFQIRNCTDTYFDNRTRPCLQYHIKRCTGPCVGLISQEDYADSLKQAKQFLQGKAAVVQQNLAEKMEAASEALEFEKAAQIRDRIRLLTSIQAHQRIHVEGLAHADVIAIAALGTHMCVQVFFFRHGRNLGTQSYPLSHTHDETLASALGAFLGQFYQERAPAPVVLLNEKPDDFQLLQEALQQLHGQKTKWEIPKVGMKKELVIHAQENAKNTLDRKHQEAASMVAIFHEIETLFGLTNLNRIEIYDNSHIQGTDSFGVMVVANREGFDKKSYRKFAIRTPEAMNDDYAMMREVMTRRFQHVDDWGMPDLLLIDGGLGQLSAVFETLQTLGVTVPIVAIAKGPNRNAGEERFFTQQTPQGVSLQKDSLTLYFLQRLRDEAHRFAIGSHRARRGKKIVRSVLDDIPGIGPNRKKTLLNHFGSAQGVSKAALADLQLVPGINQTVALQIYNFFHEK
jgi:excinuclease ABC subunit C